MARLGLVAARVSYLAQRHVDDDVLTLSRSCLAKILVHNQVQSASGGSCK
jgi:hypothetical protein